jgi:FixJ family two-component response regulator
MNTDKPVIAVVDDEESICKAFERLLRSAGLRAKTFPGGDEFLRFLQTARPACVVLDLHMPGMNGFAVLERLAQIGSTLPVIVITGDDDEKTYAKALEAGVKVYLRKPVDEQVLLDAIAPAIAHEARSGAQASRL